VLAPNLKTGRCYLKAYRGIMVPATPEAWSGPARMGHMRDLVARASRWRTVPPKRLNASRRSKAR